MISAETTPSSIVSRWREMLRWLAICMVLSVVVGLSVACFLWALDQVTALRWRHAWLLYLLPIAGAVSGWLYLSFGQDCEAGNSQIYARVKQCAEESSLANGGKSAEADIDVSPETNATRRAKVPWHMAPLVFLATLLTHLFGGSAGREGTAVQMGGAIASGLANWLRLSQMETATVLQAGVAAGFGAVFGTPLAATVFAVEVVGRGVSRLISLPACLFSSLLADWMTTWLGIEHTRYMINSEAISSIDALITLKVIVVSVAFGAAAWLFSQATRQISQASQRFVASTWLRPVIGGAIVIVIVWLLDSRQYLGLGVNANPLSPQDVSIVSSFSAGGADRFSWFWKLLLTAITIGSGFKGGEATPLFFIGSTMGNSLGSLVGLPITLAAGLGFVAVFASATRTPLACTVMAVELFTAYDATSSQTVCLAAYALIACVIATNVNVRREKQ